MVLAAWQLSHRNTSGYLHYYIRLKQQEYRGVIQKTTQMYKLTFIALLNM